MATAIRAGALTADAVALEARKAAEADATSIEPASAADSSSPGATVTFLTERRLAHLPPDSRPMPSVAAYDQLLRYRRAGAQPSAQGDTS
ncbi:hypothetical protein ACWEN6_24195 [Sphaerisporangium sp. NPDC004334]